MPKTLIKSKLVNRKRPYELTRGSLLVLLTGVVIVQTRLAEWVSQVKVLAWNNLRRHYTR